MSIRNTVRGRSFSFVFSSVETHIEIFRPQNFPGFGMRIAPSTGGIPSFSKETKCNLILDSQPDASGVQDET